MEQTPGPSAFAALAGHKYISLTTYRKTGVTVPTPVWFAMEGDRLYVFSAGEAGKVKRIRRNPRVTVAPCTARGAPVGPAVEGTARILSGEEATWAWRALRRQYGLSMAIGDLFSQTLLHRKRAYLEIVPAR